MAHNNTQNFSEETIRKLFGAYDGESENIDRLKEYYFKTETYSQILAKVPVKILVGKKGIGKSALFRIAIAEQREEGSIAVLIKPDDIAEIGEKHESLIISIRKWKFGLTDIIVKKVLTELGLIDEEVTSRIIKMGGKIIPILLESIEKAKRRKELQKKDNPLIESFHKNRTVNVYLDDIDRGWQNRKEGLIMISALINSIRDLSTENDGLLFKLALRSDVYNAVRTADESSDKFDGLIVQHSYSLQEIYVMLIKRIETFFGNEVNETNLLNSSQKHSAFHLDKVFESTFLGQGKWEKVPMYRVIMSLIRNRPRDLVKLCSMAARKAREENSNLIKTSHIKAILPEYSKSIINDTVAEYKSELPQIERLIYGMKPTKKEKSTEDCFTFTTSELHKKLFNIIQLGNFRFAMGKDADAHDLTEFLFKIGFITARKRLEDETILRKNYEEASHLATPFANFGFDWEVHLAFRWMLQAESLTDIFYKTSLLA